MMPTNVNLFKTPSSKKRRKSGATATSTVDCRVTLAMRLDMLADCELQHGHHLAAEHLTRRAQALREAGR